MRGRCRLPLAGSSRTEVIVLLTTTSFTTPCDYRLFQRLPATSENPKKDSNSQTLLPPHAPQGASVRSPDASRTFLGGALEGGPFDRGRCALDPATLEGPCYLFMRKVTSVSEAEAYARLPS